MIHCEFHKLIEINAQQDSFKAVSEGLTEVRDKQVFGLKNKTIHVGKQSLLSTGREQVTKCRV